jgi:hypothetical protein
MQQDMHALTDRQSVLLGLIWQKGLVSSWSY